MLKNIDICFNCSVLILISVDYSVTKKSFGFAKKHKMPFYYVSASDGTNVVKVSIQCS